MGCHTKPDIGTYDDFYAVESVSRNDAWAVGYSLLPAVSYILMHWDGAAWSLVPTPVIHSDEVFYAVKVFSASNVCAVGTSSFAPLSERWDGVQWHIIPTPPVNPGSILFAIADRLQELFLEVVP